MQGSFEKKVQEKLDELKLTPSAPVWEKIELEIKEEKKRRRGLLWIPLLIFLLASTGWWLWQGKGEKGVNITSNANTPSTTVTVTSPVQDKNTGQNGGRNNEKEESSITGTENSVTKEEPVSNRKYLQSIDQSDRAFSSPSAKAKLPEHPGQENEVFKETIIKADKTNSNLQKILAEKSPNLAIVQDQTTTPAKELKSVPADSVVAIQTLPADTTSAEKKSAQPVADTIAVKPKIAALPSKKWKLTLNVQAGWIKPAPDQLFALRDAASTPTQNTGGGGFSNNYTYPSRISRGTAFAAGIGLAKNLGRRWQFAFGLQYTVYSTHSRVGSFRPIDTAVRFQSRMMDVGGYYRNGNLQDYTTRTRVLELPVSLSYQVFSSLPLFVSAGGSYGYLLQSNALTFDRTSNVYYDNKQNLNRNQAAVFSSLQYGIINKKGFGLRAGPLVQYQLTTFQQETGTVSPRLLFGGLKTAVEF